MPYVYNSFLFTIISRKSENKSKMYFRCIFFFQIKIYAFNGLCVIITCALLYRNLPTSESSTQEVVFHTVPLYVQILITLFTSTIQKVSLCSYASGIRKNINIFFRLSSKTDEPKNYFVCLKMLQTKTRTLNCYIGFT